MFNRILRRINSLPKKRASVLMDNTLAYLLGDGCIENAKIKIEKIRKENISDNDFHDALKKEVNYDFFIQLYSLLNFNNISSLIRSIYAIRENAPMLKRTISNQEGLNRLLNDKSGYRTVVIKSLFSKNKNVFNDDDFQELLFKEFSVSKEMIAKEFNVDKKLFNKWLQSTGLFEESLYKPLSKRRKKGVYLDEYVLIFETLFLAKGEGKLDFEKNIDEYINRLNNQVSLKKEDIASICESDLKTQKNVFRKIAYYHFIDKFPYSLSKQLIEKMGAEILY